MPKKKYMIIALGITSALIGSLFFNNVTLADREEASRRKSVQLLLRSRDLLCAR